MILYTYFIFSEDMKKKVGAMQMDYPVGILLTCGKRLHDCIISLRGEVWAMKLLIPRHSWMMPFEM
jgi:hypothetical protein